MNLLPICRKRLLLYRHHNSLLLLFPGELSTATENRSNFSSLTSFIVRAKLLWHRFARKYLLHPGSKINSFQRMWKFCFVGRRSGVICDKQLNRIFRLYRVSPCGVHFSVETEATHICLVSRLCVRIMGRFGYRADSALLEV